MFVREGSNGGIVGCGVIRRMSEGGGDVSKILHIMVVVFTILFIIVKVAVSRTFVLPKFLLTKLCFIFSVFDRGSCRCVVRGNRFRVSIVCNGGCHGATRVLRLDGLRAITPR